jgi:hypothetical protein
MNEMTFLCKALIEHLYLLPYCKVNFHPEFCATLLNDIQLVHKTGLVTDYSHKVNASYPKMCGISVLNVYVNHICKA